MNSSIEQLKDCWQKLAEIRYVGDFSIMQGVLEVVAGIKDKFQKSNQELYEGWSVTEQTFARIMETFDNVVRGLERDVYFFIKDYEENEAKAKQTINYINEISQEILTKLKDIPASNVPEEKKYEYTTAGIN